jgi:hypothetical protein
MTVPGDRAERLAELFREIFALSETNPSDHPKSAAVDDSIKLFDTQGASGDFRDLRAERETADRRAQRDRRSGTSSLGTPRVQAGFGKVATRPG